MKVVPVSKHAEWAGLDRISVVVHAMRCIWREQEKDDIGIDGEIELCLPRSDGKGMVGTGKVIKVQAKSGASYIHQDRVDSFAFSARRRDLEYWKNANVPVVLVVYHPKDDSLYWVDIQGYVDRKPEVWEAPHHVQFDKNANVLSESAYQDLLDLVGSSQTRVATDIEETVFSNALQFISPPSTIHVSEVLPSKRANFRSRLSGYVPPHAFRSGDVITFTNPATSTNALTSVVSQEHVSTSRSHWLEEPDNSREFSYLLRQLVHKHICRLGLEYCRDLRRYYFRPPEPGADKRRQTWRNPRTGRKATRQVSSKHKYGPVDFVWHLAMEFDIHTDGEHWWLLIEPKHHYTTDGAARWKGKMATSMSIRRKAREFNSQYLNHVLFWAYILSDGRPEFSLSTDYTDVATVAGVPWSTTVGFGIRESR